MVNTKSEPGVMPDRARSSHSPETRSGAAHGVQSSPLAGCFDNRPKGTSQVDLSSGDQPMRIASSSSPVNLKAGRSRSPTPSNNVEGHFRPLQSHPQLDLEPGISRRAVSPVSSPLRSVSPGIKNAEGNGNLSLKQSHVHCPRVDPSKLIFGTKASPSPGLQRQGRSGLPNDLARPQAGSLPLGDDVFGGSSNHRRGHTDCTPPPFSRIKDGSAHDCLRPQTSPSPQLGSSLLPLRQRGSRWIGFSSSTPQQKLHTKSLSYLDGIEAAEVASAADLDALPQADGKFLPKLGPDAGTPARPIGGAKTTGRLLTHSNTAGVLSSYKSHNSQKLFLLKGVQTHRPGTPVETSR